jgi:hypothetical protein
MRIDAFSDIQYYYVLSINKESQYLSDRARFELAEAKAS